MEPIFVRVRDCACPDSPHAEGDGVYLRPTVSLAGGLALEKDLQDALREALSHVRTPDDLTVEDVNAILTPKWLATCIRHGVTSVVGDLTVEGLIDDYTLGRIVADRAADLYTDSVLVPLAQRLVEPSPTGSTNGSTSRNHQPTRRPSKPSSRGTSAATRPLPA